MRRTAWYNNTIPQEQQFTNETLSRIEELLARFQDISTRGIRRGLRLEITPDTGGLKFTVTAGQGYTPSGERINPLNDVTQIPLGPTSGSDPVSFLSRDGFQITANGSYAEGAVNYVFLRYVEVGEAPLQERIVPRQHLSIYKGSFEIEVIPEADVERLAGHPNVDVPAAPFPSSAPFPSREFRILVGIVVANGVGVPMDASNILGVDPGATQPQEITGVTITTVSGNTSPGIGRLRYDPNGNVLSWKAPADSREGAAVSVPLTTSFLTLFSSDTNLSITVRVTPGTLPTIETQESIAVVTRLSLTFPQPAKQPEKITGVSIQKFSVNTPLGKGLLSYDPVTKDLYWTAPQDTIGAARSLAGGGSDVLRSGDDSFTVSIFVSEEQLPLSTDDNVDPLTGLITETIEIRGLYDLQVPIQTADDILHRGMMGSGTPSPRNAHGLSLTDLLDSSEDNIFKDHQDHFHKNAISYDANRSFLSIQVTGDDTLTATPPQSESDFYLIDGTLHNSIDSNTYTMPGTAPSGVYLAYVSQDETLLATRISDLPSLGPLDDNTLPTALPAIRVINIKNSYTPNPTGKIGTLDVRPYYQYPDDTFDHFLMRWKAPGDSDFGPYTKVEQRMFLTSRNGDWIRLSVDLAQIDLDQENVGPTTINYTIYLDASAINEDRVLPVASFLWDGDDERIMGLTDLRSFASADNRDEVDRLLKEIERIQSPYQSLQERAHEDRASLADNGIIGSTTWNDANDADADAFLVSLSDTNAAVHVQQPKTTTKAIVRGREIRSITGIDVSGSTPVAVTDPDNATFNFAADPAVNSVTVGVPDQVCTLNSLVLDEFGNVKSYTRIREDGDIATKTIPGFQITDVSETWPVGAVFQLQYTPNSPDLGYSTFAIVYQGAGDPVTVADTPAVYRVYAADNKNWIEITRVSTITYPPAVTKTASVAYIGPVDNSRYLELARVAYDGSSEITRIIDKRKFGTVSQRSLSNEALHTATDKVFGSLLHADSRSDGVIRGLEVSGINTSRISWVGGAVIVNGKRITIPAGFWDNTFTSGVRWVYVDEDRYVKVSDFEHFRAISESRRVALLARATIDTSSTSILYIEDLRLRPSIESDIPGRRYVKLARAAEQQFLAGIDPNPPYTGSTGLRSAGWWFNCHRTRANGVQPPSFWLDDPSRDGLFALAVQDMNPSNLPGTAPLPWQSSGGPQGYSDAVQKSQFVFFRIPAGPNPRAADTVEVLGLPTFPLEVKSGGNRVLDPAVFTRVLDFSSGDFTVTTDATGYTYIEARGSTPPPPGGGSGLTVSTYGGILVASNEVLAAGAGYLAVPLSTNISGNAGDPITINITSQVICGPGGSSPKTLVAFNSALVVDGAQESLMSHRAGSYMTLAYALKTICKNGKNSLHLVLKSDPGYPSIALDERIMWNAVVYHV